MGLSAHVTTNAFVLVLSFVPCFIINYILLTVFMFCTYMHGVLM